MNLHEYQAKQLFARFNIPVPRGEVADSPKAAREAAIRLGGSIWVVKAQVHAGGRGKGGGVKLARSPEEVQQAAADMLGTRLVTKQTDSDGLPVNLIYVEEGSDIDREFYLSMLLDRAEERVTFMASQAGGMDIEEVAEETPEKIFTVTVNPATGFLPWQGRKLSQQLGLDANQTKQFQKIASNLYRMYWDSDTSMVEINPLIVTKAGDLLPLDAKINIDSNGCYRQPALVAMRDPSQEDERERTASESDLNYVSLDGNIACMVNGAGLAMATMDLIQLHGGEPANFLDVGGGATPERVALAFKLILSNPSVKAILVNIFGGIVRCDLIAEGIIQAVKEVNVSVPVVVRLEGTNVEQGRKMLADSGMDILAADDLTDAAKKVIASIA